MVTLLDLIIKKRELHGISRDFAQRVLDAWLDAHPHVRTAFEQDPERFLRKRAFQEVRSHVRAVLRETYGVFFMPGYPAKRDGAVRALMENPDPTQANTVLALHRSTAERLPYYPFLYTQIFEKTGVPAGILDLGCGFNPFSYPYLPGRPTYVSADIACEDLQHVGRFFDALGVTHAEHCIDLTIVEDVRKLPAADVAFAFKLFDTLETLRRNVTRELLKAIPARHLVASFPTRSIGQRTPINPREWFERLVTGRVLGTVTLPNEQLLIITLEEPCSVTDGEQ